MLTSLLLALTAISRNRVRAALTVLGILIGVAALIAVTTLGAGVSARIAGSMDSLGSNVLTVAPRPPPSGQKQTISRPLTESDARQIALLPSVARVASTLSSDVKVIFADHNEMTSAIGTTTDYFTIRQLTTAQGVTWNAFEEARKEKVCILGATLRETLFREGTEPLGQFIRIGRSPCRVIGTLRPSDDAEADGAVFMPIGSFRASVRATLAGRVDTIVVSATEKTTPRAQGDIRRLLRQRHRIKEGAPPDFMVIGPGELEGTQLLITTALSALLICIASVSLVVGGIGVMNIMLVSVTERTREIGIRISIGATSKDILMQFLIEAIMLSALGGLSGLLVGMLGISGLESFVGFKLSASPVVGLIAVGTSATIGIVFGYLPARRAAGLDPINALRAD